MPRGNSSNPPSSPQPATATSNALVRFEQSAVPIHTSSSVVPQWDQPVTHEDIIIPSRPFARWIHYNFNGEAWAREYLAAILANDYFRTPKHAVVAHLSFLHTRLRLMQQNSNGSVDRKRQIEECLQWLVYCSCRETVPTGALQSIPQSSPLALTWPAKQAAQLALPAPQQDQHEGEDEEDQDQDQDEEEVEDQDEDEGGDDDEEEDEDEDEPSDQGIKPGPTKKTPTFHHLWKHHPSRSRRDERAAHRTDDLDFISDCTDPYTCIYSGPARCPRCDKKSYACHGHTSLHRHHHRQRHEDCKHVYTDGREHRGGRSVYRRKDMFVRRSKEVGTELYCRRWYW